MATWGSHLNLVRDAVESEVFRNYSKKPSFKIDPIGKLQIIHALDNGQCRADVAKEYGVHPQTISYIYKQKDSIIKKYTQKYKLLNQARGINLDQTLLDWFNLEIKNGNVVHVDQLRSKAQDIINSLKEKFTCLEDWLSDFQLRHNIAMYRTEIDCEEEVIKEWNEFTSNLEAKDIYFGGSTALSYRTDFNSYLNGHSVDSYVSLMLIVNSTGLDKRQLAVVGNEAFDVDSNVRSLPLDYYYDDEAKINIPLLENYLMRWDTDLITKGRQIYLIFNIPDCVIEQLNLKNIKVVNNTSEDYVAKISDKVIGSLKYHYRRLHLSRSLFSRETPLLLDYFHMLSMAWHNVSYKYIHSLCFPPADGSLYFKKDEDDDYGNHSLVEWCKINEIPIDTELCSETLENYVLFDSTMLCYNWAIMNKKITFINDILQERNSHNTSAMEAFQAMKRLVPYLQCHKANLTITKYAKYLEDHLEYGALLQMHQIAGPSINETT